MNDVNNTLRRVDETLTFYSAGLGQDLTVGKEGPAGPPFEALERAGIDLSNRLQAGVNAWAEAFAVLFRNLGSAFTALNSALRLPLATAIVQSRDRWRKVLHRWNEPDMRAAMWDRKTVRTSGAWSTRQVGRSGRTMTLTELVRKHHDTGRYGRAHLRMCRADMEDMPGPPVANPYDFGGGLALRLMDIPVVVDEEMPANTWKLVDNSTSEVLETGII